MTNGRDYGDDLAYIHGAGFAFVAEAAAELVLDLLARRRRAGGRVVELGCGPGVIAQRLLEAGHEVVGVDQSLAMVRLARARAPAARFRVGSFVDAEIPACVAVLAVGEVLNYLSDARGGPAAMGRLFGRAHRALEPGGLLVFDLAGPGRVPGGIARAWSAGDDWAILSETEEDPRTRLLTRRMTSFRRTAAGDGYRRGDEVHHQRLYAPTAVLEMLRQHGFRARILRGYGTLRFPGHRAFVAVKPRRCQLASHGLYAASRPSSTSP